MAETANALQETAAPCATGATSVDWAELQALHVKGISLHDLAKRYGINYGTLRARSSREKWSNTVAKARDAVKQGATDDLKASIGSWVGKLDHWGHQVIDSIIRRNPDDMSNKQLQELTSAAKSLAEIVRTNYGLDKVAPSTTTNVQLNVIASTGRMVSGDVIDVETLAPAKVSDAGK